MWDYALFRSCNGSLRSMTVLRTFLCTQVDSVSVEKVYALNDGC